MLFLGSVQFVPVVALLLFAIAGALVLAGWSVLVTPASGTGAAAAAVLTALVVMVGAAEATLRWRARRYRPRWTATLAALAASRADVTRRAGGKALGLALLSREQLPVPASLVLTARLCGRVAAADSRWRDLPRSARRQLQRFMDGTAPRHMIVRSSFPDEDGAHPHAGVYESQRDVDASSRDALLHAIREVMASAAAPAAAAYRARHDLTEPAAGAVVLQAQLEPTLLGVALSRGLDGRGDVLPVDTRPPGGPTSTWRWSLVARAPRGDAPAPRAWMQQLADALLRLERTLDGPVQVEFAVDGATLTLLQVRQVPVPRPGRSAWVNGGPVELRPLGDDPRLHELRGAPDAIADVLSASAVVAPADARVRAADVRVVDGVPYVDVEALRRLADPAPAIAGGRALLAALFARLPPEAGDFLSVSKAQARLVGLAALLDGTASRLEAMAGLALGAKTPPLLALPGLAAGLLRRRARRLGAARDRLHDVLLDMERAAAPGGSPPSTDFPPVVFEPPLPERAGDGRSGEGAGELPAGATIQAGRVRGQLVVAAEAAGADGPRIAVLPDGDPRWTPEVMGAAGVVLLGGGRLSHIATTAVELRLPTILLVGVGQDDLPLGVSVTLDADSGLITTDPP